MSERTLPGMREAITNAVEKTAKPNITEIRRQATELANSYGGKVQVKDWEYKEQGGLRVLITWRWSSNSDNP